MGEEYMVITFHSTHHAIHAEDTAKRAGYGVRTVPTPRHISSDCGIALRVSEGELQGVLDVLMDNGIEHDRVAPLHG